MDILKKSHIFWKVNNRIGILAISGCTISVPLLPSELYSALLHSATVPARQLLVYISVNGTEAATYIRIYDDNN